MNSTDDNGSINNLCNHPIPQTLAEKSNIIIAGIIDALLAIATTTTNAIVFYVFIVKLKRIKDVSDLLLILLGVSDVLIGVLVFPCLVLYQMFYWSHKNYLCYLEKFIICVGSTFIHWSLTVIGFITYELYCRLTNPMAPRISQRKKVLRCVIITWILLAIFSIVFFYVFSNSFPLFLKITTAALVIMYVVICLAHYRIHKEIETMMKKRNENPSADAIEMKKSLKMSLSILIAFGCCIVFPIGMLLVMTVIEFEKVWSQMQPWILIILYLNALIDPIIYCMRMESVRKEIYKTICCKNKTSTM